MTQYDVQDPQSGKMITIEGDSPPTEEELNSMFEGQSQQQPLQGNVSVNQQLESNSMADVMMGISKGIGSVVPFSKELSVIPSTIGNKIIRPMLGMQPIEDVEQELKTAQPQGIGGKVAEFAAGLAPVLAATAATGGGNLELMAGKGLLPKLVNMGATGATQGAGLGALNQLSQGQLNPEKIGEKAITGGLLGVGIGAGGAGFEAVQPKIAQIMANIPEDTSNTAMDSIKKGINPFEKNFDKEKAYQYISSKIKQGMDFLQSRAGTQVGKEASALTNTSPIPVAGVLGDLNNIVNNASSGAFSNAGKTAIGKTLQNAVNEHIITPALARLPLKLSPDEIQEIIRSDEPIENFGIKSSDLAVSPADLHQLKISLQDKINWGDNASGLKNGLLSQLQDNVNQTLRQTSPEYAQANDYYSHLQKLNKSLGKLNPSDIASTETGTKALNDYKGQLQALNDLLPPNQQFMDKLNSTQLNDAFTGVLPKWAMNKAAMASGRGLLSLAGAGGAAAFHPLIPFEVGLASQMSPAVQKLMLQGYGLARQVPQSVYQSGLSQYENQQQGGQ